MLQIYSERPHQHLQGQNEEQSKYTFGAVEHFYPKLQQLNCVHCLYSREGKKRCFSGRRSREAQIQRMTLADTGSCVHNYDSKILLNYENNKKLVKTLPVQPTRSTVHVIFQERRVMHRWLMFSETCYPCTYSEYRSYHRQRRFCLQDSINSHIQALLTLLICARTYKTKYSHLNFCSPAKWSPGHKTKGCWRKRTEKINEKEVKWTHEVWLLGNKLTVFHW